MQTQHLDVLDTAGPRAEHSDGCCGGNSGFWAAAVLLAVVAAATVVVIVLAAIGTPAWLNSSRAQKPITQARQEPRGDVEQQVLALLSAGQQSEAEDLLAEALPVSSEPITLTKLIVNDKTQAAEQYLAAHRQTLEDQQRVLFLFAACQRSRFERRMSLLLFNTVRAIDPTTPAGQCAECMLRLDTSRPGVLGATPVRQHFVALEKLADAHPDDVMLRWMLAVECRTWDRNAEGAEAYRQILEQWTIGPARVHQTYANLLDELGRYEEALEERYKAVEIEPASWSYDGLGNTLESLHRYDEANEAHAIAVRLDPDSSLYWSNWAISLLGDGQYDAAIEKCQRSAALDPNSWRAPYVWAQALEAQGKLPEAMEKYQQAASRKPRAMYFRRKAAELKQRIAAGG